MAVNVARVVGSGLPAASTGRDPVVVLVAGPTIVTAYGVHVVPHSLQEEVVGSPGETGKGGPGGILSIEIQLTAAVVTGVAGTDEQEVVDGRHPCRVSLGVVRYVVIPAGSLVSRHNTEGRIK